MIEETSSKLRECDRRTQVGRFYYTLSALLQHESLEGTLNKANIIMYNGKKKNNMIWKINSSFEEYLSMGNITITHSFIMMLS